MESSKKCKGITVKTVQAAVTEPQAKLIHMKNEEENDMAVRAVIFDERGNVVQEIQGDVVMVKGIEYKPYPFGMGIDLKSASVGKLVPETLPEVFSSEVNNIMDKVVKEAKGEMEALNLRMKTAFLIASGG